MSCDDDADAHVVDVFDAFDDDIGFMLNKQYMYGDADTSEQDAANNDEARSKLLLSRHQFIAPDETHDSMSCDDDADAHVVDVFASLIRLYRLYRFLFCNEKDAS